MNRRPELGTGPLGRVTSSIYWWLVAGLLFVLVTAPGTIPMLFLEQHISNAPLYALFLLPVGPALAALLFAMARREDADEVTPAAYFFRGYTINAVDVLKLWIPASGVLTILAINLGYWQATGMGPWYPTVVVVLMVAVLTWLLTAVVIASLFSFRTLDTARLAVGLLGKRPLVILGVVGVMAIAGIVVVVTFDAVLLLVAPVVAVLLLSVTSPLRRDIQLQYISPQDDEG